jgi:integrase/recombinase XerC
VRDPLRIPTERPTSDYAPGLKSEVHFNVRERRVQPPSGTRTSIRFLEFFVARIRNRHTRRAYGRAAVDFLAWCDDRGVKSIAAVQPLHVAAWIERQRQEHAAPTVKARLAAIRRLFDWLVTGQVVPVNPAASVRGRSHMVKQGKTPVLALEEARALLDAIDITTLAGLRDRALIGLMVYSFARIGAALAMKVEDVYTQNRRLWVRLREKGGRPHAMPCHRSGRTGLQVLLDFLQRGDTWWSRGSIGWRGRSRTCRTSCMN